MHPLSERRAHPDVFYRDLQLLGIDGVQFSLHNTEPIRAQTTQAGTLADGGGGRERVTTLRVSFGTTLRTLQLLRPVLEVCAGLLSRRQQEELIRRMEERPLGQLYDPRTGAPVQQTHLRQLPVLAVTQK